MPKKHRFSIDDHVRGLLIDLITKAVGNDRELSADDIEKLNIIKKHLQIIKKSNTIKK